MRGTSTSRPALNRILGLGFSFALAFGGTLGTGILRLPGTVAAALGDPTLILLVWILGGLYATVGAITLSELAAMSPSAGGFYVYARRAFGPGVGFLVGWNDWMLNCLALATSATAAADIAGTLYPPFADHTQLVAAFEIATLMSLHWIGVRVGGGLQGIFSATVGLLLVALALGSFTLPGASSAASSVPALATSQTLVSLGMFAAFAIALRTVIFTYDGWYSSIYLAEETVDAARALPRAIIGNTLLLTALFVLINAAFVYALPIPVLAASKLPAADVARELFPQFGSVFVTALSLLILWGLGNALLLTGPRVLYALGRDGLLTAKTTSVGAGGTPRVALGITAGAAIALIFSGTLAQLVAVTAVVFLLNYLSAYVAIFVLRLTEADAPRPFRAWGYPVTPAIALLGTLVFLVGGVIDDPASGFFAASLVALSAPCYWWASRKLSARAR